MNDKIKKFDTKIAAPGIAGINEAAELIKRGDIVAFPTETVYGLGADCFNKDAVDKIFTAKGRPFDNPIIVHVSSIRQACDVTINISETAEKLMNNFWPGPLTLVMEKNPAVPYNVTAGLNTVAIRMPQHHIAQAIIELARVPVAAPSANLSGRPSPTTAQSVFDDLNGRLPLIIDGGPCQIGIESTVLDVTCQTPAILRPGIITHEMLSEIIGDIDDNHDDKNEVKSPGVKYKHYCPDANLTIVRGSEAAVSRHILLKINTDESAKKTSGVMCFEQTKRNYSGNIILLGNKFNLKEVAQNLYNALRMADEMGLDNVYIEALDEKDEGCAIMNRLLRAANGRVEEI